MTESLENNPPTTTEAVEMTSIQLKNCFNLLTCIKKHNSAIPFLNPVSATLVPDYYQVIHVPIDLSSMTVNLSNGKYRNPKELIQDLSLLFKNCFTYNERGTSVYNDGKKLFEFVANQLTNTFPEYLEVLEQDRPKRSASKPLPDYALDEKETILDTLPKKTLPEDDGVDVEISDLQSSLESIQQQLDFLEGKAPAPTPKRKSEELHETPMAKKQSVAPAMKRERIKRSRSTPIREGYKCEYCQDTETPM
jgi:hypothetical protein